MAGVARSIITPFKLKSFSGVEIDQNHVDKRILGGKGFAVGRLKRHNFCPASVGLGFQWEMGEVWGLHRCESAWQDQEAQLRYPRYSFLWVVFVDRWIVFSRVNVSVNTINPMLFVSV